MTSHSTPTAQLLSLIREQAVILWRNRWAAVGICWAVSLLGWAAVVSLPKFYEAEARVFVDVNGLLAPLLRGLVVDSRTNNDIGYLRQTLLSRPNIQQVISMSQLDVGKSPAEIEVLTTGLLDQIELTQVDQNLFRIAYNGEDREMARSIVESVITIFSENAAISRRLQMERAQSFLEDQINGYEEQLRGAEQRRAAFRSEFAEYLPDSRTGISRLSTLERSVSELRVAYENALTSRAALIARMNEVPATLSIDTSPTISSSGQLVAASPMVRLAQARAELARLRLRLTELHPDVIAAQRMVTALEAQVSDDSATDRVTEGSTQIANPIYEQMRLRLLDFEIEIPTTKRRLDETQAEYNRVAALLAETPDIDARAIDLDRDYEVIRQNYDELLERREAAVLSRAADDESEGTQYSVVDPPRVPQNPTSPNLPVMFSLVLFLGLGTGAGLPLGREFLKGAFATADSLKVLGLPVIGTVTIALPPGVESNMPKTLIGPALSMVLLFAVGGALIFAGTNELLSGLA